MLSWHGADVVVDVVVCVLVDVVIVVYGHWGQPKQNGRWQA